MFQPCRRSCGRSKSASLNGALKHTKNLSKRLPKTNTCTILWYNGDLTRGASALPGPTARTRSGSGCARGEVVVMRFSEFLKYLIVLLLLAIVLVAVSR